MTPRQQRRAAARKASKLARKSAPTPTSVPEPALPAEPACALHDIGDRIAARVAARMERNRQNAQRSTGPRTPAGKLASSRNAVQHGLAAGLLLIQGEDPAAFASLQASLEEEHQPATPTEALLVQELAQSYWLLQRARRLQADCFAAHEVDEKHLALYLRYGATYERAFHKALSTLLRLQKERHQQTPQTVTRQAASTPTGFVSQNQHYAEPFRTESTASVTSDCTSSVATEPIYPLRTRENAENAAIS